MDEKQNSKISSVKAGLTFIKGIMRPYTVVAVVSTMCYLFVVGKIPAKSILPIALIIIGFFFGERARGNRENDK